MPILKESNFKFILWYQIFFIFLIAILALLISNHISITATIKLDTIILVSGNFMIALFIAYYIGRKNKNQELIIDNCFEELNYLLTLVDELRVEIQKEPRCSFFEDKVTRFIALAMLQIQLIKKYDLVVEYDKNELDEKFSNLDKSLTGESNIDENIAFHLLQIESRILNIKSNIL
jgi:hypothetical protein